MRETLQPTLSGVLLLVLQLLCTVWLPGVAFRLAGLSPFRRRPAPLPDWLANAIAILINGLLWLFVTAVLLAATGILRPLILLLLSAGTGVATLIVGCSRSRWRLDHRAIVLSAAVIGIISAAPYLVRRPGEWIVGGWDPGIYLNQGILISRYHGLRFPPTAHLKDLSPQGLAVFTRGTESYREIFPGVPVDPVSRHLLPYFFPLTPVGIAVLHSLGGFPAAIRSSWWFGLLALPLLLIALAQLFTPRAAVLALAAFILHPLFLYHLHLPVSETLQLTLFCALLACAARLTAGAAGYVVLLILLLTLNRLTFFVFGALWTAIYACSVRSRQDKSVLFLTAALVLGYLLDRWFTPATFLRRSEECFQALLAGIATLIAALFLRLIIPRVSTPHQYRITVLLPVAAVAILPIAIGTLQGWDHLAEVPRNLTAVLPFAGRGLAVLAAAGLWFAFLRPKRLQTESIRTWMLFLTLVFFVLLAHPSIATLYPWAARRYLVYLVPLTCFSLAALVDACRSCRTRTIITIMAAAALALQLPASRRALACTEYDGVTTVLQSVASSLSPRDLIVADHPKWGTPLALTLGHNVLDGRRLWRHPQHSRLQAACRELSRLQRSGYRILFLTSDEEALAVFPLHFNHPVLLRQSGLTYCEVIHHPRVRTWKTRNRPATFRLYSVDAERIAPAASIANRP